MARLPRHPLSRRRFVRLALAVPAALGVPAAPGAPAGPGAAPAPAGVPPPRAAGTLRRARGGNLTTLDPHRPISAADMEIAADLFVGLTAVDARGAIVPGCAASWTVSPDGLRYDFRLRPGLRWSDGRPLLAGDFVASFRRLLAPSTGALLGYRYDAIRGARALRSGGDPAALGVAAPAADRVEVRLEHPDSDFPKLAAVAYVVPMHQVSRLGRDWAKPPSIVVNGAWVPRSWAQNGALGLERNAAFHDAARFPQAPARLEWVMGIDDATRLRLFRAGGLDVAQLGEGSQLAIARRELPGALRSVPFYGGGWIGLNTRRGVLRDARVRRALALAVDRAALVDKVRGRGERPSESLVPDAVADYPQRAIPAHADWPMPRRLAAARELLAQAGVGRAQPARLVAIFSANPLTQRHFLALGAMWAPLGVQLEARGLESRAYNVALSQRDFDLMDYEPFSAVQSATSFIGRFRSDSFLNYMGYAEPEVDRLVDLAERQLEPAARAAHYLSVERLLLRDYPVIPLYSGVAHRLVAPRVRGWVDNPGLALPSVHLSLG
jgi:ABC-type oligopeptide transport system substrate-binding subunit